MRAVRAAGIQIRACRRGILIAILKVRNSYEICNNYPQISCELFRYFCGMARPTTTTEKRTERIVPVTFATVEAKKAAQAHATKKGQTLAGLLKLLLAADMAS